MRQFFEAYKGDEKVSPLVRQLPWTHHLIILGQSKRPEEREFYLRLAIRERWSKRELERQLRTAAFERAVLSPPIVSPVVAQMHPAASGIEPEHLGKLNFYLEALDRDVRRTKARPLACCYAPARTARWLEYALSRSLSPTLIAEYQTQLPDKKMLQAKLHELYALTTTDTE